MSKVYPRVLRIALLLLVGVGFDTLVVGRLDAHSDPWGDIHPAVVVENGRFAIYFSNQSTTTSSGNSFRVIFSKDGELIAPRHRLKRSRPTNFGPQLESVETPDGERSVNVEWSGETVKITDSKGKANTRRLLWPDGTAPFSSVEQYACSNTHLALIGNRVDMVERRYDLVAAVFDLQKPAPPKIHTLGRVSAIYDFPTCSNLLFVGDRFYIAWMKEPDEKEGEFQFRLTSIDAVANKVENRKLDAEHNWNTDISMASIGEQLCIAWHGGRAYGGSKAARIEKLFISLGDLDPAEVEPEER